MYNLDYSGFGAPLNAEYRIEFHDTFVCESNEYGILNNLVILPSTPVNFCVYKRSTTSPFEWHLIPFAFVDEVGEDSLFTYNSFESDMIIFLDDTSGADDVGTTWQFTLNGQALESSVTFTTRAGDSAYLNTRYQFKDQDPMIGEFCYEVSRFFPEESNSRHFADMTESMKSDELCLTLTGVEDDNWQTMLQPESFMLMQNYPNPFNPSTTISYQLPTTAHVELAIFDITGRKIVTLYNGEQPTGFHHTQWNGLDVRGNQVGTGVYLCHLIAGNFSRTLKLVYLK